MYTEKQNSELVPELILILPDVTHREEMRELVERYHPADIAEAMNEFPHELQARLLLLLEPEAQGDVLDEINVEDVAEHIQSMPVEQLREIVAAMPPDDAAELLDGIDEHKARNILNQLNTDDSAQIIELLSYPPNTAGRIMNNEFFYVQPQMTVGEALAKLRAVSLAENSHAITVCRDNMKFLGLVSPEDLLAAKNDELIEKIMERAAVSVSPFADQEVCARYMRKYELTVLPVLDAQRRIIGLITIDDILDVMQEEASEDIYRMVGVGAERPLEETTLMRALKRSPWFIVTLLNMSLLGYIIRHFQITIEQVVAVSFFIPAIMGLSGNIGVQAATITVRGLANGEIYFRDIFWILRRELLVGMLIGVFCGLSLGVVSHFLTPKPLDIEIVQTDNVILNALIDGEEKKSAINHQLIFGAIPRFPFSVALAMFMGALGAVTLGTCVPMTCHYFGIDPAIASGPFVTTIVDIGTQTLYLSLVTWLIIVPA